MKPTIPLFPHDLSVVERVNLDSSQEDRRDKIFPIMSISKSFCGAICALMAADDKFGPKKKIDVTLGELLSIAKTVNPSAQKAELIARYEKILADRKLENAPLSEVLMHISGIRDNCAAENASYAGRPADYFQDKLRNGVRGRFSYSNDGYALVEEIINLVSEKKEGYRAELQERIFNKLELKKTTTLEESPEGMARVGWVTLFANTLDHNGKLYDKPYSAPGTNSFPMNVGTSKGGIANAGLCSTVDELTIYGVELAKMILGRENKLADSLKTDEITKFYHKDNAFVDSNGTRSLGINLKYDAGSTILKHNGGFFANSSRLEITSSSNGEIKASNIFMQRHDPVVRRYLSGEDNGRQRWIPTDLLREYFTSLFNEEEYRDLYYFDMFLEVEKMLADRLPKGFKEAREAFEEECKIAGDAIKRELAEKYLGANGVIDSAAIASEFPNIESIKAKFDPHFAEAVAKFSKFIGLDLAASSVEKPQAEPLSARAIDRQ